MDGPGEDATRGICGFVWCFVGFRSIQTGGGGGGVCGGSFVGGSYVVNGTQRIRKMRAKCMVFVERNKQNMVGRREHNRHKSERMK